MTRALLNVVRRLEGASLWIFILGLGFSISLAQVALGLLALCWAAQLADPERRRSLRFPLLAPCAALAGATVVSALVSPRPVASLTASKSLLLLGAFYLVLHGLRGSRGAFQFLSLLSLTLASVSLYGIVQVMFCPSDPGWIPLVSRFFRRCDRAHAFYSIYMTLAGVLSVGLLAMLPRLFPGSRDRRWWIAPTCAAEALALALTYVRGAWVGVAAGVLALGVMAREARRMLLAALLAGVVALLVATPGLRHRAVSIADLSDATVHERLRIWRSALDMARDHPITGVGPGGVSQVYPRYVDPGALRTARGHVHNTPLQILVERGPLALLAWLWLFASFFLRGHRALARLAPEQERERALVMGSMAATAGFLVAGLFEYNFGDSEVVMITYSVMALAFAATESEAAAQGSAPPARIPAADALGGEQAERIER